MRRITIHFLVDFEVLNYALFFNNKIYFVEMSAGEKK